MMWTTNTILVVLPSYIFLPLSLFILHKVNGEDVDINENKIIFWDENNDYDENRVPLPLFPAEKNPTGIEEEIEEEGNLFFGQAGFELSGNNDGSNNSMITIFHKIYSDNITRHGVTTIPSSLIVSIIHTALGSFSGETALLLGLAMTSLLVMIVLMMTGAFTSTLVFMPFSLIMFGLYVAMDTDLHSYVGEKMSNIPSLEEMEKIGQAISEAMENIKVAEENGDYSVPRVLLE